jgi:hypothetical protein
MVQKSVFLGPGLNVIFRFRTAANEIWRQFQISSQNLRLGFDLFHYRESSKNENILNWMSE